MYIISRLLGRISSGEEGKGAGKFGKENHDLRNGGWGRILTCRELYTPL